MAIRRWSLSRTGLRFTSAIQRTSCVPADHVDNSYKWAGGGFVSNAEDLAMLGSAMASESRSVSEKMRRAIAFSITAARLTVGAQ